MSEEREQVHGQELVRLLDDSPEPVALPLLPRVFVLADDILQPVAVVMEHDAEDGYALHRRTLFPCQKSLTLHFSSACYSLLFPSGYAGAHCYNSD